MNTEALFIWAGSWTSTYEGKTTVNYGISFAIPHEYDKNIKVACFCYIKEDLYKEIIKEGLEQGDLFNGFFYRTKGFNYKFLGFGR